MAPSRSRRSRRGRGASAWRRSAPFIPCRTTARRRAAGRWSCSARTGRISGRLPRQPEHGDAAPDPLDRWSERVLGALAAASGPRRSSPSAARPGRPSPPGRGGAARPGSRRWACSCTPGRALRLLPRRAGAGGAPGAAGPGTAALRRLPAPCLSACPVGALAGGGLRPRRLPRLPRHRAGARLHGPRLRRAPGLPGGPGRRPEAQSAFHMAAFHGTERACDA